ncbi:MAG TPA: PAS domain S-box protein [Dehalococcoidia bacterium]|nr:PAS domain S-box protein [Dehalococcoidia bacterium]
MRDEDKTKEQLISELEELRQQLTETALLKTECRQPDEALWQSEGKHRVLAESLFDTVYQFDLEGKFVYANEATTRMFGYSMDEILNSISVNDTIDEKDFVVSRRDIDEILKGKSVVGERTFIRKDGTKFVGEIHSGPVYEGEKIVGVSSVLRDISENKRMEEVLKESEGKLKTILENAHDVIFQLSHLGIIQYVSPRVKEIYGYNPEDLIGKHFKETTPVSELPKAVKVLKSVLSGKKIDNFEIDQVNAHRKIVPVEINAAPVIKDGKIIGGEGIMRDITKRKLTEYDLNKRVKELECLYSITNIVERPGIPLNELYQEVTNLLPVSWQYPEIACARIIINDKEFRTINYAETQWKQASSIKVNGVKTGLVEVNYLELRPEIAEGPFLKEERLLINAVAGRLGRITERMSAQEALVKAKDELEIRVKERTAEMAMANQNLSLEIIERRRAQETLEAAHMYQQSVIDGVAESIMVVGVDYHVKLMNRAARQFSSALTDTAKPLFCYQVSHQRETPCDGIEHPCPMEKARQSGLTVTVVHEYYQTNGERRFFEVIVSPLLGADGTFQGIIESKRDITERKRTEEALQQYTERLRALAAQLAELTEAERWRLARELHDQVGQNLTALGINLNIVQTQLPKEVTDLLRSRLEDSLTLVEQTAERIRDVMADLRPPVLDDYGLVAALHWYGDQFARRTNIAVAVEGKEPVPRLDTRVENNLFRIVQEALTNVAKHAEATLVTVTVEVDNGTLRLVVADDGIGFDAVHLPAPDGCQHFGLLIMSERAEAVGGVFRIESCPGSGTKFIVEVTR